jgi:tetratricopeptide (TPR) repeat protein
VGKPLRIKPMGAREWIFAAVKLIVFGFFFKGLFDLSQIQWDTNEADRDWKRSIQHSKETNKLQKQHASILEIEIEDLKRFSTALQTKPQPADHLCILKSFALLGFLTLQREEALPNKKDVFLALEATKYFDDAIKFYREDMGSTQDSEVCRVMYYIYLNQAMKLHGDVSRSQLEALDFAQWADRIAVSPAEKAQALTVKAEILLSLGEATSSLEASGQALAIFPKRPSLYCAVVLAHKFLGDLKTDEWLSLFLDIEGLYNATTDTAGAVEKDNMFRIDCLDVFTNPRFVNKAMLGEIPSSHELLMNLGDPFPEAVFQALFDSASMAKDYSKAWHYLQERKMSRVKSLSDMHSVEQAVKKMLKQGKFMMSTFGDGSFSLPENRTVGIFSTVPIFIIGMFKSGSTLLESMLFAHPEILTVGEDTAVTGRIELSDSLNITMTEVDATGPAHASITTPEEYRERIFAVFTERAEKTLEEMHRQAFQLLRYSSKFSNRTLDTHVKHIVDKMLFNFLNIGLIHIMFPNAMIIHIVRDPLDTAVSCFTSHFATDNWTLTLDALHDVFAMYLEVIAHFKRVLPGRLYEVQYERLVYDPENTVRGILDQLGLLWTPNVMQYDRVNRTVLTTSALQVKQKIYRKAIGSWKRFAPFLKKFAGKLHATISRLEKVPNGLSFRNTINWKFDMNFDYERVIR